MLGEYVAHLFWRSVFPGDRPSAALVAVAMIINGVVAVASSAAWKDASNDACASDTRAWLVVGIINNAIHVVFSMYYVFVLRRRASRCTVVPPEMTVERFVLRDYGLFMYGVFCAWVVVWIAVTYAKFPTASSSRADRGAIDDDDEAMPYTCDLCCVFCTVVSSVNVFYIPLVVFLIAATLVTEGFRQPRWWHTILLQDLRQRELRALYDEERPRSPTRVNSNADTDREMAAAGHRVATMRPPHEQLRFRSAKRRYDSVAQDEFSPAVVHNSAVVPPRQTEHSPGTGHHPAGLGRTSLRVGRNVAPGALRRPIAQPMRGNGAERHVRFVDPIAKQAPTLATTPTPPCTGAPRGVPQPIPPRNVSKTTSSSAHPCDGPAAAGHHPSPRAYVVSSDAAIPEEPLSATPMPRAALYESSELDAIRALVHGPAPTAHEDLDVEFHVDDDEDFVLDDDVIDFEIDES